MNAPHLVSRSRLAPAALARVPERLSARFAERGRAFIDRLGERALEGTCMGEHGFGQKTKFLEAGLGPAALELMRAIKRAIDPHGIMNPGKIVAS